MEDEETIKIIIEPGSEAHEQFQDFWQQYQEIKQERMKKLEKQVENAEEQPVSRPS